MAAYTTQEYCDIILTYGAVNQNVAACIREYSQRFPGRRVPSKQTVLNAVQRLRDTGSVVAGHGGRGLQRPADVDDAVLAIVEETPTVSTREIARRLQVSQNMVWRILRENVYHPFHYRKEHVIHAGDPELRERFCEWLLECVQQDRNFTRNVLWTDEATFTREGVFNTRNSHVWAQENPHVSRPLRAQRRFSVNLWAGLYDNRLIGPYRLPNRLTAAAYLEFLRDTLFEELPLQMLRHMWFMHDGAPPHFSGDVRAFLDAECPRRWIGRGGYISWPPRSPDLTPMDFCVWGYMKTLVYAEPIDTEAELVRAIDNAAAVIRQNRAGLDRVHENLIRRAELCLECHGQTFEHLY